MGSSKDNITAITIIITVETTIKEVTIRIVAGGIEEETTITIIITVTIIIILITIISFRASTILRVMQDMLGMLDSLTVWVMVNISINVVATLLREMLTHTCSKIVLISQDFLTRTKISNSPKAKEKVTIVITLQTTKACININKVVLSKVVNPSSSNLAYKGHLNRPTQQVDLMVD